MVVYCSYAPGAKLELRLRSPSGVELDVRGASRAAKSWGTTSVYVENDVAWTSKSASEAYVHVKGTESAPPETGTWTLQVHSLEAARSFRFDAWVDAPESLPAAFQDPDPGTLIGWPGCADSVLTVGAYAEDAVFAFSNRGPLRNGGQKPDLAGPGGPVYAALSRDVPPDVVGERGHPDGRHWSWSGTSMAAAHVTGMVALLLQQEPWITPAEVRSRLTAYAGNPHRDGYDPAWGYGKARLSCGAGP
jgi:hypothetical protein